jgi:hypothetical protein
MNILFLLGYVVVTLALVFGLLRAMDAYESWRFNRALRRAADGKLRLEPESLFVVRVGEAGVECDRPDGTCERVTWEDLQRVVVVSTSEGPMVPDTFWLLDGKTGGCAIPWGASGERELLERLQQLPGFDNGAVIAAATDVTDARRTCWERSPEP